MKVQYRVHGIHMIAIPVAAKTADGQEVVGSMPALLAELTPVDPSLKSITWIEKCPDEASKRAALALFKPSSKVEMAGFTPVTEE